MKTACTVCPHRCSLSEGQRGLCRARAAENGNITCVNYGKLTALSLDPIEKKPLRRFHPGNSILSVGSFGCNLRCPFCQNCDIAQSGGEALSVRELFPAGLVKIALNQKAQGNIGVAYTYNEPLVGYEYVRDCAKLAHENGLLNVAVTNGYINAEPLLALLPLLDALNIDLKGFTQRFYSMVGGELETVKTSIALAAAQCHVEVTTLIIPGENDSEGEMEALSAWLASVRPDIPLHVSRFFPRYRMLEKPPTPVETVRHLAEVARGSLRHVYTGNC